MPVREHRRVIPIEADLDISRLFDDLAPTKVIRAVVDRIRRRGADDRGHGARVDRLTEIAQIAKCPTRVLQHRDRLAKSTQFLVDGRDQGMHVSWLLSPSQHQGRARRRLKIFHRRLHPRRNTRINLCRHPINAKLLSDGRRHSRHLTRRQTQTMIRHASRHREGRLHDIEPTHFVHRTRHPFAIITQAIRPPLGRETESRVPTRRIETQEVRIQ